MGRVRAEPTILHVDLDAFFAAVEQRDKPSLRGKPVVVGGVGGRGVVATASYEARAYGVRSAMSTAEARSRCPHAAYLTGRFDAYRETSAAVMALLRELSPLVEPLSLDEAYVDLAATALEDTSVDAVTAVAERLKEGVHEVTGGLHGSVGVGTSKLVAKIASDLDKPDGLVVVPPGTERDLLRPMKVSVIPGVGPATAERLRRIGVHTVAELERISPEELVRLLGQAHGTGLYHLARAEDDRPVVAEREAKSVSVEGTYDTDLVDRRLLEGLLERQAAQVTERLRKARLSGRTVTVKIRLHDFSTHTRSATLPAPTDDARVVARLARSLLVRGGHLRRACACSGWASPAWPTGSRRTCSRGSSSEGPAGRRPTPGPWSRSPPTRWSGSPAAAAGRRGPTWCTPSTGRAGCGARDVAGSPCGSRPPTPGRGRSTPSAPTTPTSCRDPAAGTTSGQTTKRTVLPGRSCAHAARSSGATTPTTG